VNLPLYWQVSYPDVPHFAFVDIQVSAPIMLHKTKLHLLRNHLGLRYLFFLGECLDLYTPSQCRGIPHQRMYGIFWVGTYRFYYSTGYLFLGKHYSPCWFSSKNLLKIS